MKTKITLVLLMLTMVGILQAQWTMDSVNTAGTYPFAGVASDKMVFSNGTEWNVFDATTGTHTFGNFTIGRSMIEVVSDGGKVLFGGGKYGYFADPQYTKNVNVYNAATNSWSTWNMATAREVGGAAAIGGKAVFAGGTGRSDIAGPVYMYNKVDIFDIATGSRTAGKLGKARTNIAAAAAGNKIVFAGGWYWDMMYNVLPSNNADIYDVTTGIWIKTTLSKKRDNITAAVVGDKILFAGGFGTLGAVTNVDIYNTTTNTWSVSYMPVADYSMKSSSIGSEAFFIAGVQGVPGNIYRYNSVTGVWTMITMPVALANTSLSVIDGRLILAGGTYPGTNTYSTAVQIFDPVTNTWSSENLSQARTSVSALTYGNKGYFAGGIITYGYPVSTATKRVDIFSAPFRMEASEDAIMPEWNITVYPNPATRMIKVGVTNGAVLPLEAIITDLNGRMAVSTTLYETATPIDISALPSGVYLVTARDNVGRVQTQKLIKK